MGAQQHQRDRSAVETEIIRGIAKGDILLHEGAWVDSTSGMPRTSRASRGGFVDHVLNRSNGRSDVFHQDDDFAVFVNLMREAHVKAMMRLTGYCLPSNPGQYGQRQKLPVGVGA